MKPYIEICGGGDEKPINTGFKDQCLETPLNIPVLSNGFKFASVEEFKDPAIWRAAIANKDLVPLFPIYELTDASTEDTLFESGNFSKVTAAGVEKLTGEMYLSACAYNAVKSYEKGIYTEMFEYNKGSDYSGMYNSDGVRVQGRKITSLKAKRTRATGAKVPFVSMEITFASREDIRKVVLVESDLSEEDLEGIFDVTLVQVSASATEIKFKALAGCAGGITIDSLKTAEVQVLDLTDAVVSATFVQADSQGIYVLTGTGFATGYKVRLVDVVTQTDIMLESPDPLVITI